VPLLVFVIEDGFLVEVEERELTQVVRLGPLG
jgi:hypothetical protein